MYSKQDRILIGIGIALSLVASFALTWSGSDALLLKDAIKIGVLETSNAVQVRHAKALSWDRIRRRGNVYQKDMVYAPKGSSAVITLSKDEKLFLESDSMVEFDNVSSDRMNVLLLEGEAKVVSKDPNGNEQSIQIEKNVVIPVLPYPKVDAVSTFFVDPELWAKEQGQLTQVMRAETSKNLNLIDEIPVSLALLITSASDLVDVSGWQEQQNNLNQLVQNRIEKRIPLIAEIKVDFSPLLVSYSGIADLEGWQEKQRDLTTLLSQLNTKAIRLVPEQKIDLSSLLAGNLALVDLDAWEKKQFQLTQMVQSNKKKNLVLGAETAIAPANLASLKFQNFTLLLNAPFLIPGSQVKDQWISMSWSKLPGSAISYELQIARSPDFHQFISHKTSRTTVEIQLFGTGKYYWRVSAKNINDTVSSQIEEFTLGNDGVPVSREGRNLSESKND
ncbi:MAG: hypothetical protein EB120_02070 [Proteobacteria bacterium]|nr:hypothetical protein [Pseudomonadota bacterium]NDG25947.1 hypothetical protein [Pseudomonadota bacterium]